MGRKQGGGHVRYALWRGDELLMIGTAFEIAEKLVIKPKTVRWLASPAAKRRDNGKHMVAERIDAWL